MVTQRLFSYGTLRQPEVQEALFGRPLPTVPDSLPGYRLEWLLITDAAVIAKSGSDRHPILRKGAMTDSIPGAYLELSERELLAADAYEVDDYARTSVTLASGVDAWVYVASNELCVNRGRLRPTPEWALPARLRFRRLDRAGRTREQRHGNLTQPGLRDDCVGRPPVIGVFLFGDKPAS